MSCEAESDPSERTLRERDFFLLWAGAAISLSEIWAGGLLASFGLAAGLALIVAGHVLGTFPMVLAGRIGSRHGVPAMISTRASLGLRGAALPALLNVVQLLGWTAVMLWIGGQAAASLAGGSLHAGGWTAALGALTTGWALVGRRRGQRIRHAGVLLLLALSVVMTWLALRSYGWRTLWAAPATPAMPFMLGLDLVLAMPFSWMPLVSDYTRAAAVPGGGLRGTWWGYCMVGSWMYLVGLLASLATASASPETALIQLMGTHDLLLPAVLVVVLSTVTTTFLDIFSAAVSAQSLFPRLGTRGLVAAAGLLGTLLALLFDATRYEQFLLLIGSAFGPLFGVVLADDLVLRRGRYEPADFLAADRPGRAAGFHVPALAAWAAGFGIYHLCAATGFAGGASLPAMAGAALLYLLLKFMKKGKP